MKVSTELTAEVAFGYTALAVGGINREYPNAPQLVVRAEADLATNRALHPAFYGCFDWHSAVHSHWLLVRMLRTELLDSKTSTEVQATLDQHLTPENLATELAYFTDAGHTGFEFPYGWAWVLRLWHETGITPEAPMWRGALDPLAEHLLESFIDRLTALVAPLRSGAHRDLGFSLAMILDVVRLEGRDEALAALSEQAVRLYARDADYPWAFEPSGYDFTSSGLNEVLVMRRVLQKEDFTSWLTGFWPSLADGSIGPVADPVSSPDILDGQGSHIVGLSLSRSWAFAEIAGYSTHDLADAFTEAAEKHLALGMESVHSGGYMGEHWLASFATFALTSANQD